MDDYYAIIGVDEDASVEDIRSAYRERKNALGNANGGSKGEAAKLNKAWNVLSDPYQRGRYDEQRTTAVDDVDVDDDAAVEPVANGARRSPAKRAGNAPPRRGREPGPPTIAPPAGTRYPSTKQRIIAMVIDLLVLLVVFIGLQLGAASLARSQKPDVVKQVDAYNKQITDLQNQKNDAQKKADADKQANNSAQQQTDQKKVDDLNQTIKDTTSKRDTEARKLNPYYVWALSLACIVGLLYLAVPTALTGRTLGKWRQHLKIVRENGDPVGWSGSFLRWGPVVGVTFALIFLLQMSPLGAVIVLFGVTLWIRNPNHQGLHDRIAHTIVVTDAAD